MPLTFGKVSSRNWMPKRDASLLKCVNSAWPLSLPRSTSRPPSTTHFVDRVDLGVLDVLRIGRLVGSVRIDDDQQPHAVERLRVDAAADRADLHVVRTEGIPELREAAVARAVPLIVVGHLALVVVEAVERDDRLRVQRSRRDENEQRDQSATQHRMIGVEV